MEEDHLNIEKLHLFRMELFVIENNNELIPKGWQPLKKNRHYKMSNTLFHKIRNKILSICENKKEIIVTMVCKFKLVVRTFSIDLCSDLYLLWLYEIL